VLVGLTPGKSVALTLVLLTEGSWVNGSPTGRCRGDKCLWLEGSLDRSHKCLEFRQAAVSVGSVSGFPDVCRDVDLCCRPV
jgi:hypothetical protein